MGTKRIVGLGTLLVVVVVAIFVLKPKREGKEPLRICTWSNYYPEEVLNAFEEETGIAIELSFISSNEELLAKLKAGATGFDIIHPSDYMVRQMDRLGMLQRVDHTQLPNLVHIDDYYKNLPYDPGLKVSIPFTWGTTGIAVNTAKVKVPEGGASWNLLFRSPDFKHTSLLDDMREAFAAALFLRPGANINTTDITTLSQARDDLGKLRSQILMFSSEPRPLLVKGELTVAHAYSTDGIQAGVSNPAIKYFIPKEGAVLWTDNFAIPKQSERVVDAHRFMNYFLSPDTAVTISTQNHLATPNKTARKQLPPEQLNNPGLYPPPEVLKRLQLMDDLGGSLSEVNRLWNDLKSS